MKIIQLHISHFKGITEQVIDLNGGDMNIYGQNGKGKTSLYDAFLWLLFGKNSAGEKDFGIMPNGAPESTEPTVEGIFDIDGKHIQLKKVVAAKFARDTGEFKERKVECFINGVKKAIREYEAQIADIISEDAFRLLTNPRYFNEQIKDMKQRREILFSLCDGITPESLLALDAEFEALREPLDTYGNVDEYRAALKATRAGNAKRLVEIQQSQKDTFALVDSSVDKQAALYTLEKLNTELQEAYGKLAELKAGGNKAELTSKFNTAKTSLLELERENDAFKRKRVDEYHELTGAIDIKCMEIKRELSSLYLALSEKQTLFEKSRVKRQQLLDERKAIEVEEWQGDTICPTCGKPLDESAVEEARGNFNERKAIRLDQNKTDGIACRKAIEAYTAEIKALQDDYNALDAKNQAVSAQLEAARSKRNESTADMPDYAQRKSAIEAEIADIKSQIEDAHSTAESSRDIVACEQQISDILQKTQLFNANIAKAEQSESAQKRLEALKAEQKRITAEQGKMQQMLDIADRFTFARAKHITDAINSKFKLANFKLFEENTTNDGVREVCESVAFGAPSYKDINNAGKILVGVDIIRTLSQHYGYAVPLWIDNCESISGDFDTGTQTIKLFVSQDTELRMEGCHD